MEQYRILVTGGAGFIGVNLCKRLLDSGHHVVCLDNFSSGTREGIHPFMNNSRFHLVEADIINPVHLEVDRIYHLACPASPIQYRLDPVATLKTNVLGSLQVLELAKKNGARVLLASTSEIYGDPLVHPQAEGYFGNVNPVGERSCYNEGKRCAESLFFDYARQYCLEIKVVRIFNTYGPHMRPDDGRVISNLIVQALKGEPMTLYGDGRQTRSFCYVDDLTEGLVRMMESPPDFPGPVNIGNPEEISMAAIADMIREMTGGSTAREYMPLPGDDPRRRCPDISLAMGKLGWKPEVSLQEGLMKTIGYFMKEANDSEILPCHGNH